MLENIEFLYHNCIRFAREKVIYTDPFGLKVNYNDADIIFISHSHYDHFSPEDIEKVRCEKTVIVVTDDLYEKAIEIGFEKSKIFTVQPGEKYCIDGIKFETVAAYNPNKKFHPKENNWVGYILEINGKNYYIAGDTDITEENKQVKCDVAFVPVGGTYTMNAKEAAELVNIIKPEIAVPVHYNSIVGGTENGEMFQKSLKNDIKCKIMK